MNLTRSMAGSEENGKGPFGHGAGAKGHWIVGVDVCGSGNGNIKWTPSFLLQETKLCQANFPAPAVPSSIRLWEEAYDCSSKELNPAKKKVEVS